jgi:hypothetical protein
MNFEDIEFAERFRIIKDAKTIFTSNRTVKDVRKRNIVSRLCYMLSKRDLITFFLDSYFYTIFMHFAETMRDVENQSQD